LLLAYQNQFTIAEEIRKSSTRIIAPRRLS
jgi:hypothetical protein